MSSVSYVSGTIVNGLSGTVLANSGSTLGRFGDAFENFYGGISAMLNVPLFLACLFLLGLGSVFISQSSK